MKLLSPGFLNFRRGRSSEARTQVQSGQELSEGLLPVLHQGKSVLLARSLVVPTKERKKGDNVIFSATLKVI